MSDVIKEVFLESNNIMYYKTVDMRNCGDYWIPHSGGQRCQESRSQLRLLFAYRLMPKPCALTRYILHEFQVNELCSLFSYVHTLPKVLVMIYEELLQPLPPQLEAFGEDDEVASSVQPPSNASSCNTDPRSALSNDDLTSARSQRLVMMFCLL